MSRLQEREVERSHIGDGQMTSYFLKIRAQLIALTFNECKIFEIFPANAVESEAFSCAALAA